MGPSEKFHRDHGGDCVHIGNGWLAYSDGAVREQSAYGVLKEPPTDPYERCKIQVKYHEVLVRRAVHQFEERKQHYTSLAEACRRDGYAIACAQQAKDELAELRAEVRKRQRALQTVREQMELHMPAALKEQRQHRSEDARAIDSFLSEIGDIRI